MDGTPNETLGPPAWHANQVNNPYAPISADADYPDYSTNSATHSYKDPDSADKVITYKRRWYILLMFSLLTGTQGGLWNTWGPLTESAQVAFGWGTGTIALQTNWGPIAYIISIVFFTWLIDVKGELSRCYTMRILFTKGLLMYKSWLAWYY